MNDFNLAFMRGWSWVQKAAFISCVFWFPLTVYRKQPVPCTHHHYNRNVC